MVSHRELPLARIKEVLPSALDPAVILSLVATFPKERVNLPSGSAIAISDHFALTAKHVLEDYAARAAPTETIIRAASGLDENHLQREWMIRATVTVPETEIALLYLGEAGAPIKGLRFPTLEITPPTPESRVIAVGFADSGLALTLLAQEECAKAFVLALVRDAILPWTDDVRRSLSVHECKHLVTMVMEWLLTVNERRLNEILTPATPAAPPKHLPPDVATAMNIYRHEMIERIGRRYPERQSEWRGRARKLADGQRDRTKQAALYVAIGEDGSLASEPPTSPEAFDEELVRTKALIDFAADVDRKCIFARGEYELFVEIFRAMFTDLASDPENGAPPVESFPSGIPGVEFVKRTITVANVVPATDLDEPAGGSSAE